MGYSRSIHRVYVCIGYVSGMCRECVERNGMRVGSLTKTSHGRTRIDTEAREMGERQWRQCCAQINTPWALGGNGLDS